MTKMMTSYIIEQKLLSGELTEDEQVRMNESAWCRGSSAESCMYVPLNGTATALEMLRGLLSSLVMMRLKRWLNILQGTRVPLHI